MMIELVCTKALMERLYPGPSLQKKWHIYKGIQCYGDSFPEKGGRSVASFVLMKLVTYCLFLLTAFSQLTTCRNCISSCTAFFFFVFFCCVTIQCCIIQAGGIALNELCCRQVLRALHGCIDCSIISCFSWQLYLLAAFVYSALPHLQRMCFLWMPYYLVFFLICHAWPWPCCPWCLLFFFQWRSRIELPFAPSVGRVNGAAKQPHCLCLFSQTLFCILALWRHLCHTMVKSVLYKWFCWRSFFNHAVPFFFVASSGRGK